MVHLRPETEAPAGNAASCFPTGDLVVCHFFCDSSVAALGARTGPGRVDDRCEERRQAG